MFAKLKIPLIIVGLMLIEGVALYFLLPNKESADAKKEAEVAQAKADAELVEFDVGKFSTTNLMSPEGEIKVDCQIGLGTAKKIQKDAETAFKANTLRIKEAVNTVIRKAQKETLMEPSLSTLKTSTQRVSGRRHRRDKEYLKEIIVADFKAVPE